MLLTKIRPTEPADVPFLPGIEQSAGELFRDVDEVAWIADDENMTEERHLELVRGGASWVALGRYGDLRGFLCAERFAADLHIHELAVRRDRQQQGIGRGLLNRAILWAHVRDLPGVTLTTFRDIAWNAPWYLRQGFEVVPDHQLGERLAEILRREANLGLPMHRRCAMRLQMADWLRTAQPQPW